MSGSANTQKEAGVSVSAVQLSISLSTIIASIWAGIWGFNWAASHLTGGGLFIAILIGLAVGSLLTFRFVERSFDTVDGVEQLYYRAIAAAANAGQDFKSIPIPNVVLKAQMRAR